MGCLDGQEAIQRVLLFFQSLFLSRPESGNWVVKADAPGAGLIREELKAAPVAKLPTLLSGIS